MGTNLIDITEHIDDYLCACKTCRTSKDEYLRIPVQDPDVFKGLPYTEPVPKRVDFQYEEYRLDRFVNNQRQVIYKYMRQIQDGWWLHKPTNTYRYYSNNVLMETRTEDYFRFRQEYYDEVHKLKGELYKLKGELYR
jgi:hypothetical protein